MKHLAGCIVHSRVAHGTDIMELEDLEVNLQRVGTTDIGIIYDDSRNCPYAVQSRALNYIINDLRDLDRTQIFNTIFTRKIAITGQKSRYIPKNNIGTTILMPYGNYNGGAFHIMDRKIELEPGDAVVIPNMVSGMPRRYAIDEYEGSMWLLTMHNLNNL